MDVVLGSAIGAAIINGITSLISFFAPYFIGNKSEEYKLKLKNSELLFQKKYEATSELISYNMFLLPVKSHDDESWCKYCESFSQEFENIEKYIKKYISKHGVVLSKDIENILLSVLKVLSEAKYCNEHTECKIVENNIEIITNRMNETVNKMKNEIYSQTTLIN